MANRRLQRVNKLLREELASLLVSGVKDPRASMATIAEVRASPDLKVATVYVRALGDDQALEDALAGLESAEGFLRHELGKRLRLRRIPEFRFEVDETLERAQRIESLLEEAFSGDESDPGAERGGDGG